MLSACSLLTYEASIRATGYRDIKNKLEQYLQLFYQFPCQSIGGTYFNELVTKAVLVFHSNSTILFLFMFLTEILIGSRALTNGMNDMQSVVT